MADAHRTNYATIAGVLCIVTGAIAILFAVILAAIGLVISFFPPGLADDVPLAVPVIAMLIFGPVALILFGLGGLAIAGGLAGTRRTRWGMLIVGAAVSIVVFVLLGIPALILAILAEKEFPSSAAQPHAPVAV